jgi:uncharacterized protein (TIGR03067 family)
LFNHCSAARGDDVRIGRRQPVDVDDVDAGEEEGVSMNAMFLSLAIAVAAPAPKDVPTKDTDIAGVWIEESKTLGNKKIEAPGETAHEFTIEGQYLLHLNGAKCKFSEFKADSMASTPTIDLLEKPTPVGGGVAIPGSIMRGIYKIDGDRLTICFGPEIGERPTKFESPDGSKITLMTLKRAKKKG